MATLEELYTTSKSAPSEITPIDANNVYDIRGKYGGKRGRAELSPDNPYLHNLLLANNNSDKDAIFEMAIKWEAQRAQDEWQLEQNRQILEEQRRYDDPTARIARERRAGINSDIAGGTSASSSGGSSSMPYTAPDSPDIQNTTKFNNKYDNIASVLSSIQTLSSVAESAGNLVSMFSLLPSQLRISNAQADLAEGTLDYAKSIAKSHASSAEISALDDRIDFVGRLASFVQPDSDEASVRQLFTSLGVPSEHLDSVYGLYDHYKKSDAMQSEYNARQLRRKDSEAKNMAFTLQLLQGIYSNEIEATNLRSQSQFYIEQIQNSIYSELAKDENIAVATDTAKNTLISEHDKSALQLAKIKHDVKAFEKYQAFLKSMIKTCKDRQTQLLNGRKYSDLDVETQALYNKETLRQWSLFTCGSDSTKEVVDILNSFIVDAYRYSKGELVEPSPSILLTPTDFINAYFGDDSESNLLSDIVDTTIKALITKGIKVK